LPKDFQYVSQQWNLIFDFLEQWQLILTTTVNRNKKKITVSCKKAKKLTVSRKKAKILTVNRKSDYPIETLLVGSRPFVPNSFLISSFA